MICKLISTFDGQINFTQRLGYTIVFKQIALPIGKAIKELQASVGRQHKEQKLTK